jgi:hypothetical protein
MQVRLMRQIIGTPTREQQRLAYELQETTDALQVSVSSGPLGHVARL